jgi:hypothetical protein
MRLVYSKMDELVTEISNLKNRRSLNLGSWIGGVVVTGRGAAPARYNHTVSQKPNLVVLSGG